MRGHGTTSDKTAMLLRFGAREEPLLADNSRSTEMAVVLKTVFQNAYSQHSRSWSPHVCLHSRQQLLAGFFARDLQIPLSVVVSSSSHSSFGVGAFTLLSHCLSSDSDHFRGSPFGSSGCGNISWPQIDHAAAAVTRPAKPKKRFLLMSAPIQWRMTRIEHTREFIARSMGVGMVAFAGFVARASPWIKVLD